MSDKELPPATDFIREAVNEDLRNGRFDHVQTRFPPEPNGYLHIGHAKALAIDFGIARDYGGVCSLRYDDTNPVKEDVEYVDAIKEDIRWLGFDWGEREYYASDYFEQLYQMAVQLIEKGKAYVDDLSPEELIEKRGTLIQPGVNSRYRDRSVAENLDLFARMRAGEFPDGACTLRAKIDMASPNILLRDPVMYRILHEPPHHRTGKQWCIYPMYDFAHGQSDSIEGVTHSLCSLEYEVHRPLYEWFLKELGIYAPRQIEFARLNLNYTVMSKRKLIKLVREGHVRGWDDPRMPTLSGMRRRGFPPEAILEFLNRVGVAKNYNVVDISLLEEIVRDMLNRSALRKMAVLRPLKLVIENYPDDQVEELAAINNPEDPDAGRRVLPFSKVLYIEQDDFRAEPPPKYFRLAPGREVRLRYAYFITCTGYTTDAAGDLAEVHCTYDPATRGGDAPDGRKVKSTIHWVSAAHALPAEVHIYDRLFNRPAPEEVDDESQDFLDNINPESLQVLSPCYVEPDLAEAKPGERFQFERQGYFCVDKDSTPGKPVFNRTVPLNWPGQVLWLLTRYSLGVVGEQR
jgi:glutaminyl-tRNA synthetase